MQGTLIHRVYTWTSQIGLRHMLSSGKGVLQDVTSPSNSGSFGALEFMLGDVGTWLALSSCRAAATEACKSVVKLGAVAKGTTTMWR